MAVNLHTGEQCYHLGIMQVKGGMPAERAVELVEEKLV